MSRSDLTKGIGIAVGLVSFDGLGLVVEEMRLSYFSLLLSPLLVLAVSCSNRVELSASDRPLVSPLHVNDEVGLPERIHTVDPKKGQLKLSGSGDFETETLHGTLGERADKGALILWDEFAGSLKKSGVVVVETRDASQMEIHITDLGLFPVVNGDSVQFQMEVDAILSDRTGRVIWRASKNSSSHSQQLPARTIEAYRADKGLVRQDFTVVCRLISDELVKDLKSQME
ncbi:hypothetical protein [Haloferula sp.]|uniref:hypothetical protein n=1 Tax=Haloferula sp. TaxID=2497595 RepID=UPI00329D61DA